MRLYRHSRQKVAPATLLIALGLAITCGFIAICVSVLVEMRRSDSRKAQQVATNLVAAIAADIARNIEIYDLSLQAVVDGMLNPSAATLAPELRHQLLFDRSATAKELGSILVLDTRGQVILDSRSLAPRPDNLAQADLFRVHQSNSDVERFISQPWVADDGEYLLSISRRITGPDGAFEGVVVGNMRLNYFEGLFRNVHLNNGDVLTLMLHEGTVVMRAPFDRALIGRNLRLSQFYRHYAGTKSGSFTGTATLDGVERIYVYQQVGDDPLTMISGLSVDAMYAKWWKEAIRIGLMMLALCITNVALLLFLARELRRRNSAERRLQVLASTDALTGLGNRRQFDTEIEREWRRAARTQSPVSLVLIDADSFKAYNDRHGHQAGDVALAAIAECIARELQRGGDIGVRYGGEEFAVLLPGDPAEGAFKVAEAIRANVLALRADQAGRDDKTPTISLGVASMIPEAGLSPRDLVNAADAALYEAKHRGRNQTVIAPERAPSILPHRRAA